MLNERGFTLIEVLLATLLFSVLIGITTWGYSQYLNAWQENLFSDVPEMSSYRRLTLMRRSVEGAFDYYVASTNSVFMVPFFEGQRSGFLYVTRCPVFSDSEVALAHVEFKRNGGMHELIYSEESLKEKYLAGMKERTGRDRSMEVLSGVSRYEVAYFGLSSTIGSGTYKWWKRFSAEKRSVMPAKVDMQLEKDGREYRYLFYIGEGTVKKGFEFNAERYWG